MKGLLILLEFLPQKRPEPNKIINSIWGFLSQLARLAGKKKQDIGFILQ